MKEQGKSIIDEVIKSRIQKENLNTSIETAKKELPKFKEKINQLILKRIPKPVVKEVKFKNYTEYFQNRFQYNSSIFGSNKETDTVLKNKIATGKGKIDVLVTCSQYPTEENKKDIIYNIDVSDLDHILAIGEEGARLISKAKKSHIPDNPIIGRAYPSWPEWERELNMEDINRYSELIGILGKPDQSVEFTGSTPEIIKAIYPKSMKAEKFLSNVFPTPKNKA